MLRRGEFQSRSTELGEHLHARLRGLIGHGVVAVRGMGLWAGVDIDPALGTGKQISLQLAERGVLVKDTQARRCVSRRRWSSPPRRSTGPLISSPTFWPNGFTLVRTEL